MADQERLAKDEQTNDSNSEEVVANSLEHQRVCMLDETLADDRNRDVARHGAKRSLKHLRKANKHLYLTRLEQVLRHAQRLATKV